MKIIGKDGKTYETVEQCIEADKAFDQAEEARTKELAEKKTALSARRKELADNIQAEEDQMTLHRSEMDKIEEEWQKESKELQRKYQERQKDYQERYQQEAAKYQEASNARYQAIQKYNSECGGPYTKVYTGQRALEEHNRMIRNCFNVFNHLLDNWF